MNESTGGSVEFATQAPQPRSGRRALVKVTGSAFEKRQGPLGYFADRVALDALNNAASKALSERARKLPDLGNFGAEASRRSAPERGGAASRGSPLTRKTGSR